MSEKSTSLQDLADKLTMILSNPDLLARLAAQDAEDGSVSETLDELESKVSDLEKLYPNAE